MGLTPKKVRFITEFKNFNYAYPHLRIGQYIENVIGDINDLFHISDEELTKRQIEYKKQVIDKQEI